MSEGVYATYIYPIQFIVHDNVQIDFSIEEINSPSYDHSLLHRIIGTIKNTFEDNTIVFTNTGGTNGFTTKN